MATVSWDSAFEDTPGGDDSPDTLDDRITELKENLRVRLEKEMHWAVSESSTVQGWMKEGSAKGYYESTAPTNRPDGSTALDSDDAGRIWVDSDDDTVHVWNGSSWDEVPAVSGGTENHLVSLDANGNIKDSGTTDPNQDLTTGGSPNFSGVTCTVGDINVFSSGYFLKGAKAVTGSLHGSNITDDQVFDALSPYIPSTGDQMLVTGGFYRGTVAYQAARAYRASSTEIYIYGMTGSTAIYYSFVNGGTAHDDVSLAW